MRRLAALACCVALVGVACTRDDASNDIRVGRRVSALGIAGAGRHRRAPRHHAGRRPRRTRTAASTAARSSVESVDTPGADAAAAAVDQLRDAGIDLVLGSYGSTISGARLGRGGVERHAVLGDRRGGHAPGRSRPRRPDVPRAPDGRGAGQGGDRVHRGSGGARPTPRSRRRSGTRCRSWTTSTVGRWPQGAEHELRARGLQDVGQLRLRLPHRRHGEARAADRRREARRPVRLGVPRGRDRVAAPAGRPARAAVREHRNVVELLHAGVRRDAGRGRGRRLRLGQAVGVHDQPRRPAPGRARPARSARTTPTTQRGTRT